METFWKILIKQSVVFGARSPSKLVYTLLGKLQGMSAKNGCHKIVSKGPPLGGKGVKFPHYLKQKLMNSCRGGSRIFSRGGGGGIFEHVRKFC